MRQILTKRSLLVLGAAALGIAALTTPGSPATEVAPAVAAPRPLPVLPTVPTPVEGWQEALRFTGTVQARRQSPLGFERGGRVVSIEVDEGDVVSAGDLLAQLDDARLQLQRDEAAAALATEQARLDEALAGPRAETIEQARQTVQQLSTEVERLEREAARRAELLAEGVSATEEAETLQFAVRTMRAQRESAQAALDELLAGTRVEQIAAQQAAVALASARLELLELELARTELRAPFAGTILARHLDEGRVVDAGTPLLLLQESAALEARIGVPAALASAHPAGEALTLEGATGSHRATLRAALPEIDPATRSRTLVLDLADTGALPGETVAWQTEVFRAGAGHAIPATALVPSRRGLWAVYLLTEENDQKQVRRQEVEVLHAGSDEVIVRGLRDEDRIIASGVDRIVPGQVVATTEG